MRQSDMTKIREIDLGGLQHLEPIGCCGLQWYYAMDGTFGDLFEAQELFESGNGSGGGFEGNRLCLAHYPDGAVFEPLKSKNGVAIGCPVFDDGAIFFPTVDFNSRKINVRRFDCVSHIASSVAEIPLSDVKDCYNLMLHVSPVTLSRQPNDGTFEVVWPDRKTYRIDSRESFFHRNGDLMFFSRWFEDPDYRVETIVRSASSGEIVKCLSGDVEIMPDGELWHLKSSKPQ